MVNAVKGFGRVNKEEKMGVLGIKAVIKLVGDLVNVIVAGAAPDEAALALVDYVVDSGHDGVRNCGSNDSIANVVEGDGAGAVDHG